MESIVGAMAGARVPDQLAPNRFRLTGPVEDCAHMVARVCIETGAATGKVLVAVTEHVVVGPTLMLGRFRSTRNSGSPTEAVYAAPVTSKVTVGLTARSTRREPAPRSQIRAG